MTKIKQNGFTLIELLVVIGIFILLSILGTVSYHAFQNQTALSTAAEGIENILRQTQARAQAVINSNPHGVYFNTTNNQYITFEGDEYSGSSNQTTYPMPENTVLSSTTLTNDEIVFEKLTGTPADLEETESITIGSTLDTGLAQTISVTVEGKIGVD